MFYPIKCVLPNPPQKTLRVELRVDGRIHVQWTGLHRDTGRGYLQPNGGLLPYNGVVLSSQTQSAYLGWLLRTIGGYVLDYGMAGGPPSYLRDVWAYPEPPPKPEKTTPKRGVTKSTHVLNTTIVF